MQSSNFIWFKAFFDCPNQPTEEEEDSSAMPYVRTYSSYMVGIALESSLEWNTTTREALLTEFNCQKFYWAMGTGKAEPVGKGPPIWAHRVRLRLVLCHAMLHTDTLYYYLLYGRDFGSSRYGTFQRLCLSYCLVFERREKRSACSSSSQTTGL